MKKRICFSLLLCLALCLTGCGKDAPVTEPMNTTSAATDIPTEVSTEAPTEMPTEAPTEAPTETPTEMPTEASATEESNVPYLLQIPRADQSIFEGPGYDYVFAGTVRERGTYTIVEEQWDYEGNLWGKLKSGAGWVDVSQIRSEEYANALISANYADESLLLHGDYHYYPGDGQDYCVSIAIRAYGTLRNLEICGFEFAGDDFVMGEAVFTLPELTEEMPLVAELAFPGDMSMYGIRFVDEKGVTHVYSIYISGRNGSLVLQGQ